MISNRDLQETASEELFWDPIIDASYVGVSAKDGIVTLSGYVTSYFEKKEAERIVKRVSGVKAVVDELDIQLPGSAERSDLAIAESALTALNNHVLVPRGKVQVTVEDGFVVLDGNVDWQYERTAAEDALRAMVGVRGIANKIVVKPHIHASDIKAKN